MYILFIRTYILFPQKIRPVTTVYATLNLIENVVPVELVAMSNWA